MDLDNFYTEMDQKGSLCWLYCLTLTLNKKHTPKHNYFLRKHVLKALIALAAFGQQVLNSIPKDHIIPTCSVCRQIKKSKN